MYGRRILMQPRLLTLLRFSDRDFPFFTMGPTLGAYQLQVVMSLESFLQAAPASPSIFGLNGKVCACGENNLAIGFRVVMDSNIELCCYSMVS